MDHLAYDVICKMIKHDPKDRIDLEEVIKFLGKVSIDVSTQLGLRSYL